MLNLNLVGLPRLIIYSYLEPSKLLTDIRALSMKDLDRINTSQIIKEGKILPFKANLVKVEKHVFKNKKPYDVSQYDTMNLLVDLSKPAGKRSRTSSYFKNFYKPKTQIDILDNLDTLLQSSTQKIVSLTIRLGDFGV